MNSKPLKSFQDWFRLLPNRDGKVQSEAMKARIPILICVSLLSGYVYGQTTRRMSGTVVDGGTSSPLIDVTVKASLLSAPNSSVTGKTDSAGVFTLDLPGVGTYRVTTDHSLYAPVRDPHKKMQGDAGVWVTVKDGESTDDLELRLKPWGIAFGRAVDANGQPIAGADVWAVRKAFDNWGNPTFQATPYGQPSQSTDDRGVFRFYRLEPGEYYFHIEPGGNPLPYRQPKHGSVFYPGTSNPDAAVAFVVGSGEEVDLHSVVVPAVPDTKLRVHIVNETETTLTRSRTITIDPGFIKTTNSILMAASEPEMEYVEIPGLSPGRHQITISWDTAIGRAIGMLSADVQGSVTTVDLPVRIGTSVQGTVLQRNGEQLTPLENIRCGFRNAFIPGSQIYSPLTDVTSSTDGSFKTNLPVGSYDFSCTLPDDAYGSDLQVGGVSAPRNRVAIERETVISIIVSPSGGTVSGRTLDSIGDIEGNAVVVLMPDVSRADQQNNFRTTSDRTGSFELRGVPPGTYQLFAWPELPANAQRNAAFMSQQPAGVDVQVTSGSHVSRNVTIHDASSH